MTRPEVLGSRPDGRLYSRVTRRSAALLKHLRAGKEFELAEMAREVHGAGWPEFLRSDDGKLVPLHWARIREYLSYLHTISFIHNRDKLFVLDPAFIKPTSDAQWVQVLSDRAREHLARVIGISPADLPSKFEQTRQTIHHSSRVPTVAALLGTFEVEGGREEEIFRWSLYLYTDGPACPYRIRQHLYLSPRD